MRRLRLDKLDVNPSIALLWAFIASQSLGAPSTGEIDQKRSDSFTKITLNQVSIAPEDYKNKKVTYTGTFRKFSTTFLAYMEKSGFKPDKHFMLLIGDKKVPVIAKKNKELTTFMATIKKGDSMIVYGRIKKFRVKPQKTIRPHYYLELHHINLVSYQ